MCSVCHLNLINKSLDQSGVCGCECMCAPLICNQINNNRFACKKESEERNLEEWERAAIETLSNFILFNSRIQWLFSRFSFSYLPVAPALLIFAWSMLIHNECIIITQRIPSFFPSIPTHIFSLLLAPALHFSSHSSIVHKHCTDVCMASCMLFKFINSYYTNKPRFEFTTEFTSRL